MSKRRRISRIFKFKIFGINLHTLFEIICSAGFIIQSILILINYFSYPELTNIHIEVPEATDIPDVVICFDGAYMINWTKAFTQYPQLKSSFLIPNSLNQFNEFRLRRHLFSIGDKNWLMMILARSLTIRQLHSLYYNDNELIDSIALTNYTVEETKEYCAIRNAFRSLRICYIFACSQKGQPRVENMDIAKSKVSNDLLTINLHQSIFNYATNFFITLVPPNVMPRGNSLRWDTMTTYYDDPRYYKMHFFIFERWLLPAPYRSNCFDYNVYGFRESIDMKDNCFNNQSMKYFNVPFHASTITRFGRDISLGLVKYADNANNKTFREILDKMVDHCFEITKRLDCHRKVFFIRPRNPISITGNKSIIAFGSIKEPNIRVIVEPRFLLLDVFIAIGSISGTWFGFSIVDHVPKIYRSSWHKVSNWIKVQNRTETKVVSELRRRASQRSQNILKLGSTIKHHDKNTLQVPRTRY